jgi:hypothetical protein
VVHAPISLLPSPLPRSAYDQVVALARDFNVLVHRASNDHAFICSSLERCPPPPNNLRFPPAWLILPSASSVLRVRTASLRACWPSTRRCMPTARDRCGAHLVLALRCETVLRVRVLNH